MCCKSVIHFIENSMGNDCGFQIWQHVEKCKITQTLSTLFSIKEKKPSCYHSIFYHFVMKIFMQGSLNHRKGKTLKFHCLLVYTYCSISAGNMRLVEWEFDLFQISFYNLILHFLKWKTNGLWSFSLIWQAIVKL